MPSSRPAAPLHQCVVASGPEYSKKRHGRRFENPSAKMKCECRSIVFYKFTLCLLYVLCSTPQFVTTAYQSSKYDLIKIGEFACPFFVIFPNNFLKHIFYRQTKIQSRFFFEWCQLLHSVFYIKKMLLVPSPFCHANFKIFKNFQFPV